MTASEERTVFKSIAARSKIAAILVQQGDEH
jgi:hypothetical protein